MKKNAILVDVKRFALHDGPGIRTVLFLKGCPLQCRWCHNPESISSAPEPAYFAHKCINCGECVSICPAGAHELKNGKHLFRREKCTACGKCETVCLGRALKLFGQSISLETAVEIVLEDRDFYGSSGGLTLSGGEPLLQADFCAELCRRLKQLSIHCAIDTSGAVNRRHFTEVIPYTDLFLYDVKHADEQIHLQHTGQSCKLIWENLTRLAAGNIRIEIRIPVIPNFNDDIASFDAIGKKLAKLAGISMVRLLPYHDFARSKYAAVGRDDTMPETANHIESKLDILAERIKLSTGYRVIVKK
ncbi:MAG: glycyl-radical enzyme activating protein [Victivallales bacterium]|nr:glycyl-radical enzyme activating protein [Victivallales bacterium]